jgi:cyclohexyl-isocyanide hydratase
MHAVMLLFPRMTQLDLTGPYDVLAKFEELTLDCGHTHFP